MFHVQPPDVQLTNKNIACISSHVACQNRRNFYSSMAATLPCAAVAIICNSKPRSQIMLRTLNMFVTVLKLLLASTFWINSVLKACKQLDESTCKQTSPALGA